MICIGKTKPTSEKGILKVRGKLKLNANTNAKYLIGISNENKRAGMFIR